MASAPARAPACHAVPHRSAQFPSLIVYAEYTAQPGRPDGRRGMVWDMDAAAAGDAGRGGTPGGGWVPAGGGAAVGGAAAGGAAARGGEPAGALGGAGAGGA